MLNSIVVVLERRPCIVRRVDEHALHLARKLLFECFQRQQVVAEDQAIVELIVLGHSGRSVIRLLGIFEKDAWFQAWSVFFADPRQFEFLFLLHSLRFSVIQFSVDG